MEESSRFSTGSTAKLSPSPNQTDRYRGRLSSSSGRYSLPTAEVPPQKATPRTNSVGIGTRLNVPESLAQYLSSTPVRLESSAGRHISSPSDYRQFATAIGTSTFSPVDGPVGLNSVRELTRYSEFNNEDFLARKELQQHQSMIESLAAKIHKIEEDVRGTTISVGLPSVGLHKVLHQNVDSLRVQMDSVIAAKNSELSHLHSKLSRTERELETERMLSAKDKLRSQLEMASRERELQQLRNQLGLLKEELRNSQEKCYQAEKVLVRVRRERDRRRNCGVGGEQSGADQTERDFLIRKVADLDQRVQNLSAPYLSPTNSSTTCICESNSARNTISMSDSFVSQDKHNRMRSKYRLLVNQLQCQLEEVQNTKDQSFVHQELQNSELTALRKSLNEAELKNQTLLDQINAEVSCREDKKILEEIRSAQTDILQCQKAIDWLFAVAETLGRSEIPSVELMLDIQSDSESSVASNSHHGAKVDLAAETLALRKKVDLLTHRLSSLQSFVVERFGKAAAQEISCVVQ